MREIPGTVVSCSFFDPLWVFWRELDRFLDPLAYIVCIGRAQVVWIRGQSHHGLHCVFFGDRPLGISLIRWYNSFGLPGPSKDPEQDERRDRGDVYTPRPLLPRDYQRLRGCHDWCIQVVEVAIDISGSKELRKRGGGETRSGWPGRRQAGTHLPSLHWYFHKRAKNVATWNPTFMFFCLFLNSYSHTLVYCRDEQIDSTEMFLLKTLNEKEKIRQWSFRNISNLYHIYNERVNFSDI